MGKLTDEEILKRRIEPLDYSPSSGSIVVPYHQDGPTEHDGRSQTHTTFYPSQASNQPHRDWESMSNLQDGQYAGGQSDMRGRHADQERDLDIFMEEVNLRPQEKFYAKNLLAKLHRIERDRDGNGSFYTNGEALLLAVLTFAANNNDRRLRPVDEYQDLRESLNVEKKSVRTERKHIREQI